MPPLALDAFLATWRTSAGNERANVQSLPSDLSLLSRVDTPEGPRWHRPQALGA